MTTKLHIHDPLPTIGRTLGETYEFYLDDDCLDCKHYAHRFDLVDTTVITLTQGFASDSAYNVRALVNLDDVSTTDVQYFHMGGVTLWFWPAYGMGEGLEDLNFTCLTCNTSYRVSLYVEGQTVANARKELLGLAGTHLGTHAIL